jgi:hypothetical protein
MKLSHPQLVLYFSVLAYVSLPMFPGIIEYGSQNMRIIKDAKIQHPPAADGIIKPHYVMVNSDTKTEAYP